MGVMSLAEVIVNCPTARPVGNKRRRVVIGKTGFMVKIPLKLRLVMDSKVMPAVAATGRIQLAILKCCPKQRLDNVLRQIEKT